jgi:Asp-tRNA(Asn)/Glu-tRNA(Gln) amidotransferase A subunit family amidase
MQLSTLLLVAVLATRGHPQEASPVSTDGPQPPTMAQARGAAHIAGLEFTDAEIGALLGELDDMRAQIVRGWVRPLDVAELPALRFDVLAPGIHVRPTSIQPLPIQLPAVERPADLASLIYADIPTLAALIRDRKLSCVELTQTCLARLKQVDEQLHCVVSFTEERALAQARALDQELVDGEPRSLLHGIPWGAKDLLATAGTRTSWGAEPYREQRFDEDATVVQRLDQAGAVLIAKLSLGALAYGDVWFGGKTRNPWKPDQGSSGSSAGPAADVVAGGVVFAIGSETYGSIISPSRRCGASSLRPTFGRVSRHGAMALVWSMDKLGPMCRSLRDTSLVLPHLIGPDGKDPTVHDLPFAVPGEADISGLRVGYPAHAFDDQPALRTVLDSLRELGVDLVEVSIPEVEADGLNLMLAVEAAAAFDELTRSDRDDLLTRQDVQAWPNLFRAARLIPAVEYVNASRRRSRVMREMDALMATVDVLVHPNYAADLLLITNHTGHPQIAAPAGFREDGTPLSISFTGRLFDETTLLAVAEAWQRSGDFHEQHPDL